MNGISSCGHAAMFISDLDLAFCDTRKADRLNVLGHHSDENSNGRRDLSVKIEWFLSILFYEFLEAKHFIMV